MRNFSLQSMKLRQRATEGKILNAKAKTMTVEGIVDKDKPTDLQDLKQQIKSLNHYHEKYYRK